MSHHHYRRLLLMGVLSFLSMYALMYAMVDVFSNVYPNFNQLYMATLMTAAMLIIKLALMGPMYPNKKLNAAIVAASIGALILSWVFIRQQTAISDKQFLKSMIPHYASAILMCEKGSLEDPEIQALCRSIISGQQSEIQQMRAKLRELGDN